MDSFELFLSWGNKNMTHKFCSPGLQHHPNQGLFRPFLHGGKATQMGIDWKPFNLENAQICFPTIKGKFHCFNKLYPLDGHQILSAARNGLKTPRNQNLMGGPIDL